MFSSLVAALTPLKVISLAHARSQSRLACLGASRARSHLPPSKCARAATLLLAAALAFPTAAQAAGSTLSFAEAQRVAAQRSLQIVAEDAAITSARQMAVAAGQLPDPILRAGIDNLPIEGSDRFSLSRDFMTMRRIGVMQEFTRADKRRLRSARMAREADRTVAEKSVTLAAIQRDTAIAWLDTYYLQQLRSAVDAQAQESRLEIEAAESAYRGGRSSQADVLMAQSSRVVLEDRLSEIDRRIRNARAALARWIGERAADATLVDAPALDTAPIHRHGLEQQLTNHPDIAVMNQAIAMADADVQLAQANKQADWTWELAYQRRGPAFSDMVSVGVSIPLQWDQKNRQDRELAAKLALADKARAQRDDMLRQHLAEVQTMVNEWENGRERLGRYEGELLPLARARTQALVSAYRGGKSELAAVVAARRNEIDVRAQAIELEIAIGRAWAQLRYLYPDEGAGTMLSAATTPIRNDSPVQVKEIK